MSRGENRATQARLAAFRSKLARFGRIDSRGALLCRTVAGSSPDALAGGDVTVKLYADGTVTHDGLQVCHSAWACPHCTPNIASTRAGEVEAAVRAALLAGYVVVFFTMTLEHRRQDSLEDVFGDVRRCWREVVGGGPWVRFRRRWGHLGTIRTLEVTAGRSGWHPHVHGAMIFRHNVDPDTVRSFLEHRWTTAANKCDRTVSKKRRRDRYGRLRHVGVDVQLAYSAEGPDKIANEVGAYLCKWGVAQELSAAWSKDAHRGRYSALALLVEAEARGGGWAVDRWCEYEAAVHGMHFIHWSPGLKAALANLQTTPDDDRLTLLNDVSDDEAARCHGHGPVEATAVVPGAAWNRAVRNGGQHRPGEELRAQVMRRHWQHLTRWMRASGDPPN